MNHPRWPDDDRTVNRNNPSSDDRSSVKDLLPRYCQVLGERANRPGPFALNINDDTIAPDGDVSTRVPGPAHTTNPVHRHYLNPSVNHFTGKPEDKCIVPWSVAGVACLLKLLEGGSVCHGNGDLI